MDWKLFTATFGAIFFAELADKTQLVSMGMAAKSGKPLVVLAASVAAYILITLVSILLGVLLAKYLKPDVVRVAGASMFILIGVLMLAKVI